MKNRGMVVLLAGASLLGGLTPLHAQQRIRRSQHGTVTQTIAGTEVKVIYNRPVARGRTIYGGVLKFGEVWNPGADQATQIEFSTDVRLNGHPLKAGKYTIWMVPEEKTDWTVIISNAHDVYHIPYPEGQDAVRFTVKPRKAGHMETLAFYFPVVHSRRATLNYHWGELAVPIEIEVP